MKIKRALNSPKILIVFSKRGTKTSTRFGGFVSRLKKHGAFKYAIVEVAALEDMVFFYNGTKLKVIDIRTGKSIDNYDVVYFKGWESSVVQAYALSKYLQSHGIPYFDEVVIKNKNPHNKLTSTVKYALEDLATVPSLYVKNHNLIEALDIAKWRYPLILKSLTGQKGQNNYLVKTKQEMVKILKKNPHVDFMVQKYIRNNGDWRIVVLGGKAKLGIYRTAVKGSHLNNTSQGADAKLYKLDELDPQIVTLAEAAASKMDLQVVGIDIIEDKKTNELYILEANTGSQIATGAFVEEKIQAFDEFIAKAVRRRYGLRRRVQLGPKRAIGRHELVDLPDFGIENITAKTDTGAYSSALHAENIRIKKIHNKPTLLFEVPVFENGLQKTASMIECKTTEFNEAEVKNSFGNWQKRYKIKVRVIIQGREYKTEMTLSNRESQRCPMLLGRKVLRGNFLVNVELSRKEVNL